MGGASCYAARLIPSQDPLRGPAVFAHERSESGMEKIVLIASWAGIFLGFLIGGAVGLHICDSQWLGGYASWPRRMVRLGHISMVAMRTKFSLPRSRNCRVARPKAVLRKRRSHTPTKPFNCGSTRRGNSGTPFRNRKASVSCGLGMKGGAHSPAVDPISTWPHGTRLEICPTPLRRMIT